MQYQHIDPAVLMDAAGDDQAAFDELLGMFVHLAPGLLRELDDAVRGSRPEDASRHAHTLKSTLALVGAHAGAARLEQLDRRARLREPGLDRDFDDLYEHLLAVIAEALACRAATGKLTE